ncbi:hypothetical protein U27_02665 [Candidatus Vecturithrix granuli]|uniref:Uncharacterized protein n=1 Tax=Vecturithrix granuli TaxID=1499967 RepID=A0A081BTQ2_VECG1|nr:hypothetical protein U27_02665 [Candidatus Vecturithrix granuli]
MNSLKLDVEVFERSMPPPLYSSMTMKSPAEESLFSYFGAGTLLLECEGIVFASGFAESKENPQVDCVICSDAVRGYLRQFNGRKG